ncbi:hypothetical protein NFI96_024367 [Prochilodus magdalenae]|nr:hypothetical protein NFI96_024367 [Prochilodus magdalenae]
MIDRTSCSRFNINRANVWDGAIQGFERSAYNPSYDMLVKFSDDAGQTEEALDTGGPKREFLTLLMDAIRTRRVFDAAEEDEHFHVGRMIAVSIVHGGPGPRCLSPNLFQYLTGKVKSIEVPIEEIPDEEVRNALLEISRPKSLSELQIWMDKHSSMLQTAGCFHFVKKQDDEEKILHDYIQWYFIYRSHFSIQRFKEGLATLNVGNALEQHPSLFRSVMCCTKTNLTADAVEDIFQVELSALGSTKRQDETRVLGYWRDYLLYVEDLEDLTVTTGSAIPATSSTHPAAVSYSDQGGNFIDELDTLLSLFPVDGSPLLLLGHFNLPSDKLQSSCLQPLLSSFDLTLNPSPPTHRGGNTLDLVFSRPTPALDVTVTPLHCSDHYFLSFTLSCPALPVHITPSHSSFTRRNLRSVSPSSLASTILTTLPHPDSFSSLSLNTATDTLLSSLSSAFNHLCPLSPRSTRSSPPAPWLSDVLRNNRRELRRAERKWRRSQLDSDLHTYQAILSRFSGEVTSAKSSFYKRKLEESASDPRKLFSIFSSLLNPPSPPPPSSLTPEDFVTFFEEKVNKIRQSFSSVPAPPSINPHPLATKSLNCFSSLSTEDVLQLLESSNPTTCPLDPIPSTLLQSISLDLLPFISSLINCSLSSGHVPQAFKTARVFPILKKPSLDSLDISSYRPVSLLSFLSKILERAVYNQLSFFLSQNQLQDINQSGFKPAHSTETALIVVTERLHAARSAKLSSVLILLDLSAAFDTVNHKILLSVLTDLGITGTAWKWFESYLEDRHYQAQCWVLFSLYTLSLGEVITSHSFSYHCYADDTQLMLSFPSSDTQVCKRISACLTDISSWMTAHHLKLNPSKTELL